MNFQNKELLENTKKKYYSIYHNNIIISNMNFITRDYFYRRLYSFLFTLSQLIL